MWISELLLLSAAFAADSDAPAFRATLDPSAAKLHVEGCFVGPAPSRLSTGSRDAAEYLLDARFEGTRLRPGGGALRLPDGAKDGCLHYSVDLAAIQAKPSRRSSVRSKVDAYLLRAQDWLWQPAAPIKLTFDLPKGYAASVPWPPTGQPGVYRVDAPMRDWPNLMAIGPFSVETIPIGDQNLRASFLRTRDESEADLDSLKYWLKENASAVATVYGRFPLDNTQVLVVPTSSGDAVTWAQVNRGGSTGVHFFVNEKRDRQEFMDDWTAAHEFSHTLHPYLTRQGRWVSEGMASYYQNVARARAGLISESSAWRKLEAGFQRGRDAATRTPLREAVRSGAERRNYMRIYWSGAALALLGDVELRSRTDGKQSLDTALSAFRDCCLPSGRSWEAREFLAKLDSITGHKVFVPLFEQIGNAPGFPDVTPAYRQLGIDPQRGVQPIAGEIEGALDMMAAPTP